MKAPAKAGDFPRLLRRAARGTGITLCGIAGGLSGARPPLSSRSRRASGRSTRRAPKDFGAARVLIASAKGRAAVDDMGA